MRSRLIWPTWLLVVLAVFGLVGCDRANYHRSSGQWMHGDASFTPQDPASFEPLDERFARDKLRGYCRGAVIDDSDGASFTVVSQTEARDRSNVYHCDTYRKAQEYWTAQHLRIVQIEGADAATYVSLGEGYARDKHRVYISGVPFKVRDPASFEPLGGDFAHDAERGYYARVEIPGSHGPSFESIDARDTAYARDRANAYYGYRDAASSDSTGYPRRAVRTLRGADPAALRVLGRDYAADARHVWHQGQPVVGADPATFVVEAADQGAADAQDKSGGWKSGQRVGVAK
ncbi:DKNYY domain-containing protein [Roseateles sp.]|uniref:DKNYY domain-containing protein n=1 Tax=Roseateles sp. TaxID=1971397 RepID=UPI0032661788